MEIKLLNEISLSIKIVRNLSNFDNKNIAIKKLIFYKNKIVYNKQFEF